MTQEPGTGSVVLVYADKGSSVIFPQSLLYLAAILRQRGIPVSILDTRVEVPTPAHFQGALAVGVSAMTGHQIRESLIVCEMVRKVSLDIKIIWGGIHPTLMPEQTLAHPLVDMVVRGEGEDTLPMLVERIKSGSGEFSDIPGLTYHDASGTVISTPEAPTVNLDSIPPLPYNLLRMDRYMPTKVYFPYQVTRGCPFKCTFCYNQGVNSRWRYPAIERVIAELRHVHETYGLEKNVHFLDDNLLVKPSYAVSFFEAKMRAGLDFEWNGSTTIKGLLQYTDEQLLLLKRSGLTFLRFGAESGSPKIIRQIRKNFTPEDAFEAVEKCRRAGIEAMFNFMVGFPGETALDREMTFDFIDELYRRFDNFRVKTLWRLVPFPGTEVFEQAVKEGYPVPRSLEEWAGYGYSTIPRLPWTTPDEFAELMVINSATRYPFKEKPAWSWRALFDSPLEALLPYSSYYRWKYRFFRFGYEWNLRSYLFQRAYGKGTI